MTEAWGATQTAQNRADRKSGRFAKRSHDLEPIQAAQKPADTTEVLPCTGKPELWSSVDRLDHQAARQGCLRCPFIAGCHDLVASEVGKVGQWAKYPVGTWAGALYVDGHLVQTTDAAAPSETR